MLDFLRRRRSKFKWVWIALIFIFSVTLVTLYIPFDELGNVSLTSDVATVADDAVSSKEFSTAYKNYLNNARGQLNPEILRAFRFDKQILDSLINRKLMLVEARRLGLRVSRDEIERRILQIPVFTQEGKFVGQAQYQQVLAQNNLTVEEFEESVADDILMDKLRSFVTSGVSVSDAEGEQEYRQRNEKAKLDYFVIDASKLEESVVLTDAEQRDYYEKNKTRYSVGEKRRVKYIHLDAIQLRTTLQASDDELRQYYGAHRQEYELPERVTAQHILLKTQGKQPAEVDSIREKARQILERAKKGEDFGALAKQFSEDSSAPTGGDLGSFGRDQMVPEFERVAFSLGPGAISDLVTTQFGIHIIKVNEKTEARVRPFEEIKEAIRPIVLHQKALTEGNRLSQEMAVDVVKDKNLERVAQSKGAAVKETPLFESSEAIPEIGTVPDFSKRVFELKQGEVGTAIALPGERGWVIPLVTEIQPAHPASFEEAQSKLLTDLKGDKGRTLAAEKAKQVEELLNSGKDLKAAAALAGAEIKASEFLTRGGFINDFGSIADIDDQLFSLPLRKPGKPLTIANKTLGFAITERQDIKADEMRQALPQLKTDLSNQKRDRVFQAFTQELRKKMESSITINESVLSQLVQTTS